MDPSNRYQNLFHLGMKLITHLYLVQILRMQEAVPPFTRLHGVVLN